ncbi:MAG: MFS transporter [Holophagales bacterium]|jgi:MFS family permease|nr:MFS transporter [Holophagales bacterium]
MKYRPSPSISALVVVSAAFFTDTILYYILVPLLPYYQRAYGLSQTDIGVLFGCYAASLLLGTIPIGKLGDMVGRRRMMLWGLVGLWGTTLLFAFGTSFSLLVFARVLQGLSATATWTSGMALVADHWPARHRGKAMSTCFAFANLGALVGPPFSGYISEYWGVRAPFIVAGGIALVDALLRVWLLQDKEKGVIEIVPLRRLLKNKTICLYVGVLGMGSGLWAILESVMPTDFDSRGWSQSVIGLCFAFAALAHTLTSPLAGAMADKFSRKNMVVAGLLLTTFLLPAPALVHGLAPTFALMIGLGLVATLVASPVSPAVTSAVDALGTGGGGYSSAFGLLNLSYAAGMMVGPLLGGVGVDAIGLKLSLAICGLGFGVYALVIRRLLPEEISDANPT